MMAIGTVAANPACNVKDGSSIRGHCDKALAADFGDREERSQGGESHHVDGGAFSFRLLNQFPDPLVLAVPEEHRMVGGFDHLCVADHLRAAPVQFPVGQELLDAKAALVGVPLAESLRPRRAAGENLTFCLSARNRSSVAAISP
jgi:hypothetical protein